MAKAELGTKRRCLSCAAPFFDLGRTPIVCPKCGADYQIVEYARSRPKWAPSAKTSVADDPAEPELADASDEEAIPLNDEEDDSELDETIEAEHDEAADV